MDEDENLPAPETPIMGRPTKYKKKYCKMLIDHMKKGLTYETFAATIDDDTVCRRTLYD